MIDKLIKKNKIVKQYKREVKNYENILMKQIKLLKDNKIDKRA